MVFLIFGMVFLMDGMGVTVAVGWSEAVSLFCIWNDILGIWDDLFYIWDGLFDIWEGAHLDGMGVTVAVGWSEAVSVQCRQLHHLLSCPPHPQPILTPVEYLPDVICLHKLSHCLKRNILIMMNTVGIG